MSAQQDIEAVLETLAEQMVGVPGRRNPEIAVRITLEQYREAKQAAPDPSFSETFGGAFIDMMRLFLQHFDETTRHPEHYSRTTERRLFVALEQMQQVITRNPATPADQAIDAIRDGLLAHPPEAVTQGLREYTQAERIADEIQTQYGATPEDALLFVQHNGERVAQQVIDVDGPTNIIQIRRSNGNHTSYRRATPVHFDGNGTAHFGQLEIDAEGVRRGETLRLYYPRLPLSVAIFAACPLSVGQIAELCDPQYVDQTFRDHEGRDWRVRNEAYHPTVHAPIGYVPPVVALDRINDDAEILATAGLISREDEVMRRPGRNRRWSIPRPARIVPVRENTSEVQLDGHTIEVEHVRLLDGEEFYATQRLSGVQGLTRDANTIMRIAGPFMTEIEARAWMTKLFYAERAGEFRRGSI